MTSLRTILVLVLAVASACATAPRPEPAPAKPFAMKVYYMAFLRRGPRWIADESPERKRLLQGHMANIRRLGAAGSLLIAGPFDLPDDARPDAIVGIFIFDVASQAEAEALVRTDPTIAAGHFAAEVVPWYGPSGLTYDGREAELERIRKER